MFRKVVRHGTSTLIISLPAEYVRKYNIKKGDYLDVVEEDEKIIISKTKINSQKYLIKDKSNIILNIQRAYYNGYQKIFLPDNIDLDQKIIDSFGFLFHNKIQNMLIISYDEELKQSSLLNKIIFCLNLNKDAEPLINFAIREAKDKLLVLILSQLLIKKDTSMLKDYLNKIKEFNVEEE